MDKIFIEDLRVDTVIGLYDWEKQVRQSLSVSMEMGWDIRTAAKTGDLTDTLNYADVADYVQAFANEHDHLLLESFIEDLADRLLKHFHMPWIKVRVAKISTVSSARSVGIEIERHQESAH